MTRSRSGGRRHYCIILATFALFAIALATKNYKNRKNPYLPFKSKRDLFRQTRCAACQALFSELLLEVRRHNLHANGEEDILDSVEAACLGVVQNYTVSDGPPWITFSPQEQRLMQDSSVQKIADMKSVVQRAMLMKETCMKVGEELGNELSEGVWREANRLKIVSSSTGPGIIDDSREMMMRQGKSYCNSLEESGCNSEQFKKTRKKKAKKLKNRKGRFQRTKKEGEKENAIRLKQYSELLETLDADGSLSNMLLLEQSEPGMMLPDAQKNLLQKGRVAMQCDVCNAIVNYLVETSPSYILKSEANLVSLLEGTCIGPPDTSTPPILGIPPPPLPPLWTDHYRISRSENEAEVKPEGTTTRLHWSLEKLMSFKTRPGDPRKYRERLSGDDHLEKLILTESCKLAIHGNEDKVATKIAMREWDLACMHVCAPM